MSTNSIILAIVKLSKNYSLPELNRYSVIESNFKSDVSTSSTKRALSKHFIEMPQFDFSTLSIILFSSLISAGVYYSFISLQLLPDVITTFKFRVKRLLKSESLDLISVSLPNLFSYNSIVNKSK